MFSARPASKHVKYYFPFSHSFAEAAVVIVIIFYFKSVVIFLLTFYYILVLRNNYLYQVTRLSDYTGKTTTMSSEESMIFYDILWVCTTVIKVQLCLIFFDILMLKNGLEYVFFFNFGLFHLAIIIPIQKISFPSQKLPFWTDLVTKCIFYL